MTPSRFLRLASSSIRLVAGLAILACLGARPAWSQESAPRSAPVPKAPPEAERARRLQERDRYFQEAVRLGRAGKKDEALAAFAKKLAIDREVLGELHEDVVKSLLYRTRVYD